jgi:hypothetical protein
MLTDSNITNKADDVNNSIISLLMALFPVKIPKKHAFGPYPLELKT